MNQDCLNLTSTSSNQGTASTSATRTRAFRPASSTRGRTSDHSRLNGGGDGEGSCYASAYSRTIPDACSGGRYHFQVGLFPLELNLGLEYNPQQASDEAAVGMGINRIIVTDGVVSLAKHHWED
jgi:hypothetical protein